MNKEENKTEKEIKKEEKEIKKEEKKNKKNKENEKDLKIKELEDKLLRSKAEFINFKKRQEEQTSKMLKYSNESILLEIIPIIDNFERALNMDDSHSKEVSKYKDGIKMIHDKVYKVFEKFEVKQIGAVNEVFDPFYHQAVLTANEEDKEKGIILEVMQKGYIYKDRVIRPAMVKVNN